MTRTNAFHVLRPANQSQNTLVKKRYFDDTQRTNNSSSAHLEESDKVLADVERYRHESVQEEEVVEELHHEVADEVAAPSQHLAATKKKRRDGKSKRKPKHVTVPKRKDRFD